MPAKRELHNPKASYHHGDLRQALLDAGDGVLQEQGLKGFTLRECARRAGVSHAAPKHHFGDVTGFLTEIAALGFMRLSAALELEIAGATNLDEEFIATTRAYVDFAEAHPEHFRIMFRCDLLDDQAPNIRQAAGETFRLLTNVILRQRGEPSLSASEYASGGEVIFVNVIHDIVIGWSHIHGLAHLKLERQLTMVPEDMHEALLVKASRRLATMLRQEAGNT
ncbi:MAG: TetR/AcrR family transcriptional regulator [Pseudomonadales bacterium]|jgi:AcrR family transcriptional regulator|nr:TetR/AcrR family transcriptional regulator [Pseudomonadales bacterium]MDP4765630.1 TetR/AcrR family transcriptional regulator [Pseudomonadales bacterium]MDP4875667.1 TetR/AcrR family transcriptional regulator [Pseudomonadales bacterium]MDP4910457.1 TetR/AcrR family transcriptional regulator [Pseudomonadales bacterium]MDP5059299.1 TetR/AcrR family transcriptional regulator [Pseudomonadales bacterium]